MTEAKWYYPKKAKVPNGIHYVCDRCGIATIEGDSREWFDFKYERGYEMCPRCREEFKKEFVLIPKLY